MPCFWLLKNCSSSISGSSKISTSTSKCTCGTVKRFISTLLLLLKVYSFFSSLKRHEVAVSDSKCKWSISTSSYGVLKTLKSPSFLPTIWYWVSLTPYWLLANCIRSLRNCAIFFAKSIFVKPSSSFFNLLNSAIFSVDWSLPLSINVFIPMPTLPIRASYAVQECASLRALKYRQNKFSVSL